jgi:hypothetical protein
MNILLVHITLDKANASSYSQTQEATLHFRPPYQNISQKTELLDALCLIF